ncbi:aldehyde dehydrogenase [Schizophyllum amplum]|uniref:Aldehyde dehydrogenase n=1 Tax=Schizophyllum amplum TaxID=97359 RepID=A0A550C6J9_9AGAR|nr:aldehyde dehydrogenase [Auriculariopsis ampla]
MAPFTPLFIDGASVPAHGDATYEVRNPLTGDLAGTAAAASYEDCVAAIEAAQRAFKSWKKTTLDARRDIMGKAADLLATDKYKAKIAIALKEEVAATPIWGYACWLASQGDIRNVAPMVERLRGEYFPSSTAGGHVQIRRKPWGVVFGIAPWNAGPALAIRAVACAILCGNTVVLKASEVTPRTHAVVAEGVLNYLSISREASPELVAKIIAHPLVRHVNFTGSDRVGKIIAVEAAKSLKPCVLELGGKAPAVVLDDADLESAAKAIIWASMINSGQVCQSTERVIVQRGVAEALTSKMLSAVFSEPAAESIVNMIKEAHGEGAVVLLGDMARQGALVQPHIVKDVKPGMKLWERETFGPVVVVAEVDTLEEAVEMANASEYSLTSAVWTQDIDRIEAVAPEIQAGFTNINGPTFHRESMISLHGFGGASGYGRFDVDAFTEKHVLVTHSRDRQYPGVF